MNKPMDKKSESVSKKVGDAVERTGEKITQAGAEKIGGAVKRAGDKLEHSSDSSFKKEIPGSRRP